MAWDALDIRALAPRVRILEELARETPIPWTDKFNDEWSAIRAAERAAAVVDLFPPKPPAKDDLQMMFRRAVLELGLPLLPEKVAKGSW